MSDFDGSDEFELSPKSAQSDEFRTRIANAVWMRHRADAFAQVGLDALAVPERPIPPWAYGLADAVIRELNLAKACEGGCVWQIPSRFEDMTPQQRKLIERGNGE